MSDEKPNGNPLSGMRGFPRRSLPYRIRRDGNLWIANAGPYSATGATEEEAQENVAKEMLRALIDGTGEA